MSAGPRIIKLGGSLLEWPAMPEAFHRWLSRQSPAANVLIAGGGPIVESLRQLDRALRIPPETAHWLAVRAMGLNASLAAELLDAPVAGTIDALHVRPRALQVLDVEQFLRRDADASDALPCSWDVTSDSIAARVAEHIQACELVLLKSSLPREAANCAELSRQGYVDRHLARMRGLPPLRCVNLRDEQFSQIVLP